MFILLTLTRVILVTLHVFEHKRSFRNEYLPGRFTVNIFICYFVKSAGLLFQLNFHSGAKQLALWCARRKY
ncbi:hypothetical protein PMIT1342_00213 [Prochlorococcus marinus str. MIT 1342]|nr:hypothetical protein PMIT1342_00213 [Prochlorococcus marinus str. MIT 1342]